jgi:hypothetical protein
MTLSEQAMLLSTFPNRNPAALQASIEFVQAFKKEMKAP